MKLKSILFSLLLLVSIAGLKAQDKYEYGVVTYAATNGTLGAKYAITSSITGGFKVIAEGKLEDGIPATNFDPVNKYINELAQQGWEVYNNSVNGTLNYQYFYVRKKKN